MFNFFKKTKLKNNQKINTLSYMEEISGSTFFKYATINKKYNMIESFNINVEVEKVIVPEEIKVINAYAFSKAKVKEIIFLGATDIGDEVFSRCKLLERVEFSADLKGIGNRIFTECDKLREVRINNNPNYKIVDGVLFSIDEKILYQYLYGKKSLFLIPKTVEEIRPYAFNRCGFSIIFIPSSVLKIGAEAFYNFLNELIIFCEIKNKPVLWDNFWNNANKVIWGYKSKDLDNIISLSIYYRYTTLSADGKEIRRFLGGSRKLTIPNEINKIAAYAFSGTSIQEIYLSESIEEIEDNAFNDCNYLNTFNFPQKTKKIGTNAFFRCSALTKIIIPESVNYLGDDVFSECKNLKQVTIDAYISKIPDNLFYNCNSLEYVFYPKCVNIIGNNSFYNCLSLKTINLSNIIKINDYAFLGNASLERVNFSDNLLEIGESSFSGCKALKNIKFPPLVTTIPKAAFSLCTSINCINLPENITRIEEYAFSYCENLQKVIISENIAYIGDSAFVDCNKDLIIYSKGSKDNIWLHSNWNPNNYKVVWNFKDRSLTIDDLNLKTRPYNCLVREGIIKIGKLINCTENDLLSIRNLGIKSLENIKSELTKYNFKLKR